MGEVIVRRTLAAGEEVTFEVEERRSRFICQLCHVSGEAEARAFIDRVRSRHRDARHNVPAWILADGRERAVDDGEPARTAGAPTLEVLRGAGLIDVCAVTSRYFGGTLLGTGGLIRAYTQAALGAVAEAEAAGLLVEQVMVVEVTCCIPYAWHDQVVSMATRAQGKVRDRIFTDEVQLTVAFRAGDEEDFLTAMEGLAQGADVMVVHEPVLGEF